MAPRSTTIEVTAQLAGRVARAVGVLGATLAMPVLPAMPVLALLPIPAAAQSASDGMIMIPGNGESAGRAAVGAPAGVNAGANPAANAALNPGATGVAGMSAAQAARAEAEFQAAARGAQIVIPGNGAGGANTSGVAVQSVRGATTTPYATRNATPSGVNAMSADEASARAMAGNPVSANAARAGAGAAGAGLNPAVAALLANRAANGANAANIMNAVNGTTGTSNDAPAQPANVRPNSGFESGTGNVSFPRAGVHRLASNLATSATAAATTTNDPSAPAGADHARLQQQAASELSRDGSNTPAKASTNTAATANLNTSRNVGTAPLANDANGKPAASAQAGNGNANVNAVANVNANGGRGPNGNDGSTGGPNGPGGNGLAMGGKPALQFSARANVPTAHTMPSLDTIAPGRDLGSAMSPAARFAAAASMRHAADATAENAEAAVAAGGSNNPARARAGADTQAGTPASQFANANSGVGQNGEAVEAARAAHAAPVVTVLSDSGPPIEHSVTIERGAASMFPEPALAGKQDPAVILKTAEDFLRQQATGLPGRVTITVPPVAPRGLAACDNLQAFMAPGAPLWGRTTVGVRCIADKPWTFYVVARISVKATYYVAAREILPGDVIQAGDLLPRDGDLAVMPRAIVTDPSQAIGAVAQMRITPGLPLRSDVIRSTSAIQLGQTVKVVAEGNGFSISVDGSAMNNASPGQQVRVKTDSGQLVVGTAIGRGVVQIPM
ncbi:MAG TPA: flagellar basal body P-ring formation chaperone FlgA [Pararobbsia sp.]|nr:flagellar basal body P-ring formation chaperone FlgA [Pararobbsia sp.]